MVSAVFMEVLAENQIAVHPMTIPTDFEEYLKSVPWDKLNDGYGPCLNTWYGTKPLPTLLRELCSDVEYVRQDAVNDGIWSRAYHQGSLYLATPYAGKALVVLLRTREVVDLPSGNGGPTVGEILKFLVYCVDRALKRPADFEWPILLDALREDTSVIETFRTHPNSHVQALASNLLNIISHS